MAVLEVIKERGDVVDLLKELAFDLTWTWEPRIQAAFEALDPELWEESGHNPVVLLARRERRERRSRASRGPGGRGAGREGPQGASRSAARQP
jgi:Protein of unknown function (DUF3417)